MDQPFLNPATLKPLSASAEEQGGGGGGSMSIKSITSAKLWARRRRRSLFVPQRRENDFGSAFLAHADFPKARAKSLSALNRERKADFDKQTAYKMMEQVLNMELAFKSYDAKECATASNKISKTLKDKLWNMFDLSGCKVVCLCYITKRTKPSLAIDSGCAWDEMKITVDKDAFVDYVYKNHDIVAVASVFVISCQRQGSKKTESIPRKFQANRSLRSLGAPHFQRQLADGTNLAAVKPPKKDEWVG